MNPRRPAVNGNPLYLRNNKNETDMKTREEAYAECVRIIDECDMRGQISTSCSIDDVVYELLEFVYSYDDMGDDEKDMYYNCMLEAWRNYDGN